MALDKPDEFETAFAEFSVPDKEAKPAEGAGDAGGTGDGQDADAVAAGGDAGAVAGADGADAGDKGGAEAAAAEAGSEGGDATAAEPAEGAEAKPGEGAAEVVAKAEPAATDADGEAILARLTKLVKEAPVEAKAEDKPAAAAADEKPLYTDDEKAFLETYDKDWGDVSRGEELKRRAHDRELVGYVFEQIGGYVAPLKEMIDALAQRTHISDLEQSIGKYDDNLRDEIETWAKDQPKYLQDAYLHVIDQGTAGEVKDLVERYRKDTGKVAAPVAAEKKDVELSADTKKAAEELKPVKTKRAGVQAQEDPGDFDAGWKRFADSV